MNLVQLAESEYVRDLPEFNVGDTVQVHYRIIEGKNERVQIYEGIVIARNNSGTSATFTVRKISSGIGVERVFPLHSPRIEKIVRVRLGRVRRAKLYYLRSRKGKSARVPELIRKKSEQSKSRQEEQEEVESES